MSLEGPSAACSTKFRVPANVAFSRIKAICLEIIPQIEKVVLSKAGAVQIISISDGTQQIAASFWVKDSDMVTDALTDFHVRLLERLNRENITLSAEPLRLP